MLSLEMIYSIWEPKEWLIAYWTFCTFPTQQLRIKRKLGFVVYVPEILLARHLLSYTETQVLTHLKLTNN